MKRASFEHMLGKKTRCHYKRNTPRTTILRAILPVGKAETTQAMRTVFGNYGLKTEDFCEYFNINSQLFWETQQLIQIVILISPSKTYLIEYKLPTVYSLLNKVFKFRIRSDTYFMRPKVRKLLVATVYKIAIICSQSTNLDIIRKYMKSILISLHTYSLFDAFRYVKVKFNFRRKIKNPDRKKVKKEKKTKMNIKNYVKLLSYFYLILLLICAMSKHLTKISYNRLIELYYKVLRFCDENPIIMLAIFLQMYFYIASTIF